MTVDGPDERPLALRDLAHEESPEIVRAALGRFRRRLLMRGLVFVLIVATGVFLYPRYSMKDPSLQSEFRNGRTVLLLHEVLAGEVQATIFEGARLSSYVDALVGPIGRYGLRIAIDSPWAEPDEQLILGITPNTKNGVLETQTAIGTEGISGLDVWMSVTSGTRVIDIPVAGIVRDGSGVALAHKLLGTVHIEMDHIGAPTWLWR